MKIVLSSNPYRDKGMRVALEARRTPHCAVCPFWASTLGAWALWRSWNGASCLC